MTAGLSCVESTDESVGSDDALQALTEDEEVVVEGSTLVLDQIRLELRCRVVDVWVIQRFAVRLIFLTIVRK